MEAPKHKIDPIETEERIAPPFKIAVAALDRMKAGTEEQIAIREAILETGITDPKEIAEVAAKIPALMPQTPPEVDTSLPKAIKVPSVNRKSGINTRDLSNYARANERARRDDLIKDL